MPIYFQNSLQIYPTATIQEISSSRKSHLFIGSLFFAVAALVIFVVALISFPLLWLYITAGIMGGISLVLLGIGIFTKPSASIQQNPLTIETYKPQPIIQTDFKTWLNAYGYSNHLTSQLLFELLEYWPLLASAINIDRDFEVFKPFIKHEKWNNIIPILTRVFFDDKTKIVALLTEETEIFKTIVENINQLEHLNQWSSNNINLKLKIWQTISSDENYFQSLINNGYEATTNIDTSNPYHALMSIFNGEEEKRFLTEKMNVANKVGQQNLLQKDTQNDPSISPQEQQNKLVNQLI